MQIYVHRPGADPEFMEIEEESRVALILERYDGVSVWLEDIDEEIDVSLTLREAGVGERAHVHVSRCKKIEVRVRYGGRTIERSFTPSATIQRVFDWATGGEEFDLTKAEKAKHALGICDTTTEADKADHVGKFASAECKACFDLAPKERFEG